VIGPLPVSYWPSLGGYNTRHAKLSLPKRSDGVPSWLQCPVWAPDGSIYTSSGYVPAGMTVAEREDTLICRHTRNPADPSGFWIREARMRLNGAGHGTGFALLPDGSIALNWQRKASPGHLGTGVGDIVDQLVKTKYVAGATYWLDSPGVQPYGEPELSQGYVLPYYDADNDYLLLRLAAGGGSTFTLRRRTDFELGIDEPGAVLGPITLDHAYYQGAASHGFEMLYLTGAAHAGDKLQMVRLFDLTTGRLHYEVPAAFAGPAGLYQEPEGILITQRGVTGPPQVCIGYTVRPGEPVDQYSVMQKIRHPKTETASAEDLP